MKVNVLLFGVLADKAGISSLEIDDVSDINNLMDKLKSRFTFLENSRFIIARNQEVVRDNTPLRNGDEIALLPPFAGG